ncbi:MAG: acetate kinase [bacterium]|nr:acetate kinase [bacterium]
MSILVINSGSTSIKYKLFADDEKEIKQGNLESVSDHLSGLKQILRQIGDLRDLAAVGHRVVHGGDKFIKPLDISEENFLELEKYNELAPLHNPYNLAGIRAAMEYLPRIKQVAVFDTAFFADLPETARRYALPAELAERYKLYRYGFHGLSHQYIAQAAAGELKIAVNKINLISCHLGGGWSVAAIKAGKPIDISMGWTPLEGLVMMTRTGDLDPGIVLGLLKLLPGEINEEKINRLENILNRRSGIKGLAGVDNFLELIKKMSLGDEEAKLAFDIAVSRLVKYIGAYFTELEGRVDAIVFTGAIGAGNPLTRNRAMAKLKCLGKLPMLAIKTNEELMIMREVNKLIGK